MRTTDEQIEEWALLIPEWQNLDIDTQFELFRDASNAAVAERDRADAAEVRAERFAAERDEAQASAWHDWRHRVEAAEAQLAAVRELHVPERQWYDLPDRCKECLSDYPCDTIRVLDGDPS